MVSVIGSYPNFAKQCNNLRHIKERILSDIFPADSDLHIIDGVPIPLCHYVKSYRCRSLKELGSYGFCAAKKEHYYGLRGHPVINEEGYVIHCTFTGANIDEREVLHNLQGVINGMLLGDKGFISAEKEEILARSGVNLQTPKRKNMKENRGKKFLAWMKKTRKYIETVISQLTEFYDFNKIRARNLHCFMNKAIRKILAYNFTLLAKS